MAAKKGYRGVGVGMPHLMKLNEFGSQVWNVFGRAPLLVGTALTSKKWRDVDVRLVLPDAEYVALFDAKDERPGPFADSYDPIENAAREHWNADTHKCGKWVGLCLAFSALGKEMTGLPIDFQIQPESTANMLHPPEENPRYRLGFTPLRMRAMRAMDG